MVGPFTRVPSDLADNSPDPATSESEIRVPRPLGKRHLVQYDDPHAPGGGLGVHDWGYYQLA